MDMKWIERTIITLVFALIAYIWNEQAKKIDIMVRSFMNYKVYVAENFVSKKDYNRDMKKIDQKLDRIIEILDKKADKDEIFRRIK